MTPPQKQPGIEYWSERQHEQFEGLYLALRSKEQRLYSDDEVHSLPYLSDHPLVAEWKLRQISTRRVLDYLKPLQVDRILEIGTGNGWFAHQLKLAKPEAEVWGTDINKTELEQGARVFTGIDGLRFAYFDVFQNHGQVPEFDLVVMNACIQYFPDLHGLVDKLKQFLAKNGEIHVLDSPVYKDKHDADRAAVRSREYYRNMGYEQLSQFYHHHYWDIFRTISHKVLYKPGPTKKLVKKLTKIPYNPFPWIKIEKQQGE